MEDNLKGRKPQSKTTLMEDDLNERGMENKLKFEFEYIGNLTKKTV